MWKWCTILIGIIYLLPTGHGLTDEEFSYHLNEHRIKVRSALYQQMPPYAYLPPPHQVYPSYPYPSYPPSPGNWYPAPSGTGNNVGINTGGGSTVGVGIGGNTGIGVISGDNDGTLWWCPPNEKCPPYHKYNGLTLTPSGGGGSGSGGGGGSGSGGNGGSGGGGGTNLENNLLVNMNITKG